MGALRVLLLVIATVAAVLPAGADDLVMPYACAIDRGTPHLTAAEPTTYEIIGPREDMPFSACRSAAAGSCETMMVHKFTIDCGGQKIAWSKVAAAGRAAGVDLPARLPPGFAPVSRFKARFVLPGFGRTTRLPKVETRALSADSVVETSSIAHDDEPHWVTVIDPVMQASASGGAFKVAGVISTLLISLMAACLFMARRRMPLSYDFARSAQFSEASPEPLWRSAGRKFTGMAGALQRSFAGVFERSAADAPRSSGTDGVARLLDAVHARVVETELLIASLPTDLLLRDVLQTELDALRSRVADVSRRADQMGEKRASSVLRAMLKDLDRITRIVQGTTRKDEAATSRVADVPSTIFDAYRILGLNPEAPPVAVKKVVDALRMSWHPDHARSEPDRRHREERIKQINAAWDLLKGVTVEAA
ncbi:Heat shock protein DnaJ domain protein [Hyphomicrobium sp. GJ21]|nr:Heat shock protein DnaJ domain protein [Hyphomicrobium sp. GJ21]